MYRVFCCNKFIRTCHSGVKQPAYWVHFQPVPKEQIHLHTLYSMCCATCLLDVKCVLLHGKCLSVQQKTAHSKTNF